VRGLLDKKMATQTKTKSKINTFTAVFIAVILLGGAAMAGTLIESYKKANNNQIKIVSPKGGEAFELGKSFPVKIKVTDKKIKTLIIVLYKGDKYVFSGSYTPVISYNSVDEYSLNPVLAFDTKPGQGFKLEVSGYDGKMKYVTAVKSSGLFKLYENTKTATTTTTTNIPMPNVSGPANTDISGGISEQGYHVATLGNDSNTCDQAKNGATPKKTITSALTCVSAGEAIIVSGGTYEEMVTINKNGTASNPITIKAANGEKVVITGSNVRDYAFNIDGHPYIIIDGFEVQNTLKEAIFVHNSNGTKILNNSATGKAYKGIYFSGSNDLLIENNQINLSGPPAGKTLQPGIDGAYGQDITIRKNKVLGAYAIGIDFSQGEGKGNLLIEQNWVQKSKSADENVGIELRGTNNSIIRNNVVEGTGITDGILVRTTDPTGHACTDVKVLNNTVYMKTSGHGIKFYNCGGQIKNNLISRDGVNSIGILDTYGNQAPVDVFNNLIYNFSTAITASASSSFNLSGNVTDKNPGLLLSGSSPDSLYSISSSSPAKNAGDNSVRADVGATDFSGNARINGTIDIGAFEVR
jgi:parallel beta-helix repeat protein